MIEVNLDIVKSHSVGRFQEFQIIEGSTGECKLKRAEIFKNTYCPKRDGDACKE